MHLRFRLEVFSLGINAVNPNFKSIFGFVSRSPSRASTQLIPQKKLLIYLNHSVL